MKMVKLKNISQRTYMHKVDEEHIYELNKGKSMDIPEDIAKIWLKNYPDDIVAVEDVASKDEKIKELEAKVAELEKGKDEEKTPKRGRKAKTKDEEKVEDNRSEAEQVLEDSSAE